MPRKVAIVWGEGTLFVRGLPLDYAVQQQLVAAELVFDREGGVVTAMPQEKILDPASHYCVPYCGLVKLMQAITERINATIAPGDEVKWVLVDPFFWSADEDTSFALANFLETDVKNLKELSQEQWRSVEKYNPELFTRIEKINPEDGQYKNVPFSGEEVCFLQELLKQNNLPELSAKLVENRKQRILTSLRKAFGGELPGGFEISDEEAVRKFYYQECNEQRRGKWSSISACIEKYRTNQGVLPADVCAYYLDVSSPGFHDDSTRLKAHIDRLIQDKRTTEYILDSLLRWRLRQSLKPVVTALQEVVQPHHIVLVTTQQSTEAALLLEHVSVVQTPSLLELMHNRDIDSISLLNNQSVGLFVRVLLDTVTSLCSDRRVAACEIFTAYMAILRDRPDFMSVYTGAHLFITHPRFSTAFKPERLEDRPVVVRQAFTALYDYLEGIPASDIQSNADLQTHLEVFLAIFTGFFRGTQTHNRSLLGIIPEYIIRVFERCIQIYGRDPHILFRLFFRWVTGELQATHPERVSGFLNNLIQTVSAYVEKPELMERLAGTFDVLTRVLLAEIKQKTMMDEAVIQRGITLLREMHRRLRLHVSSSSENADQVAAPQAEPAAEEAAPPEPNPDHAIQDQFLRTCYEARVEIFPTPTSSMKEFLECRLRIAGKPEQNLSLVFKQTERATDVVAIQILEANGKMKYYRRDGDRLKQYAPITHAPIISVTHSLSVNDRIVVTWGVNAADVYLRPERDAIPPMPAREEWPWGDFPETHIFAQLYQSLTFLADTTPEAREVLWTIEALELREQEHKFLAMTGDSSDPRIQTMLRAYQFMHRGQGQAFFLYTVHPEGLRADFGRRSRRSLATWDLFLGVSALVSWAVLIWCYESEVIPWNDGDIVFLGKEIIAQLMRAAILTIYVGAPMLLVSELSTAALRCFGNIVLRRRLAGEAPGIPNAIAHGSYAKTLPYKLYQTLLQLSAHDIRSLPGEARSFMQRLEAFAKFAEGSSALPRPVVIALEKLGQDISRELQHGSDEAQTRLARMFARIHQLEETVLGANLLAKLIPAIAAAVMAGIYYGLVNTHTDEETLSPLIRNGLYALGIAALYLLYKLPSKSVESAVVLGTHGKGGFFLPPAQRQAELTGVVVNDAGACEQTEPPAADTPLLGGRRRPGRGCPLFCSIQ